MGISDLGLLESALAQPRATFDGRELYADVPSKAATLGYCLIGNHGFTDGNKRVGHAAMEAFLMLNGWEIVCGVDEQEKVVLQVASGEYTREQFGEWLLGHVQKS